MRNVREVLSSVEDHIDHPAYNITDRLIERALEALQAEGYVIVPREPTQKMIDRASSTNDDLTDGCLIGVWQNMIDGIDQ